jgi:hypothetical protein
VLLSYSGVKLSRPLGRISADAPEIHVIVHLEATFFAPRLGDRLEATVSRVGSDHLALLILGVFNASVPLPAGPDAAKLKPDDTVELWVRGLRHADGMLSVQGELCGAAAAGGKKRRREPPAEGADEGAGAGGGAAAERKHKRSKEEKEEKRRRKAEKKGVA